MKIVIFGAGGIGSFYGAMLAKGGADVWFVARGRHLAAMREKGLRVESLFGDFSLDAVKATDDAAEIGAADLIIVSVKQYQTAEILDDLQSLIGDETILLTFQNGIDGHAQLAERFGAERVMAGVPVISSNLIEPGFVRHVASGEVTIGELNGEITERANKIARAFGNTVIPIHVAPNVRETLWHKLLWNAGFSSVICLTGCDSQEVLSLPETREIVEKAIAEAIHVGKAQDFNFAPNHLELLMESTAAKAPIRTSMLLDREAGKPLEYEAITGAVVKNGKRLGVPVPVNEILYAALKAIDRHNRRKIADSAKLL